ncbi:universal stress protein [Kribbella sp. NBC_00382]|uniref:universal stress protein n=1 Tax=Kribbella sp. NBC_00382 TaxID=2975967 RepID=UPI002E1D6973
MTRERVVVAGVDGSTAAETAIRWAADEAASRRASLRLVHAFVWPEFKAPVGPSDLAPGLAAGADKVVEEAVQLARKLEPEVEIEGTRHDGFPAPILLKESKYAELLVIGSRGLSVTLGALVGSTGLDLAANAHCPVVIVRPDQSVDAGDHVMVGYDGSPASSLALDFGLDYARRHGLHVRVVATRPLYREDGQVDHHDLEAEVRGRPDGTELELVEVTGHPAEQLLRLSADARLIVLGSRGRGGFAGMLIGSVSQTVLHHALCPVAVIPAGTLGG